MTNEHLDSAIDTTLAAEARLRELWEKFGSDPGPLSALIIAFAIDSAATKMADAATNALCAFICANAMTCIIPYNLCGSL